MAVSATRKAGIELHVGTRGMDPGIRDGRRKLRAFEREQASAAKAAARDEARAQKALHRSASGVAKGALFGLAAAAGFDVAGGLGTMVKNVFDVEKELTRFGIDAQLSSEKLNQFRDATRKTSDMTGQSQLAIVEAAHAYQILTGDAAGAIANTRLFAEVANASGASMHDIADVGASLNKNLGIDPDNFRAGFDVLLNMGHKASVELRDFAAEMSTLNPLFKDFGAKGPAEKLAEMAAALEVTKYNFANASEASAGFRAAMSQISKTKPAERLAQHGVSIWTMDPKTKTHVKRDYFDIIADIHDKIKDRKVLADILGGRQESYRAITAELDHYDEMVKLKNESNNSDQVAKDNSKWMNSSTGQLAAAYERVKNAIAAAFTPERMETFAKAMTTIGEATAWAIGKLGDFLGKLEGVAKGLAELAGGKSWDDQVTTIKADRMRERTDALNKDYEAQHRGFDPENDMDVRARDRAVRAELGREQQMQDILSGQARGDVVHRQGFDSGEQFGVDDKGWLSYNENAGKYVDRGAYNMQELVKLRDVAKGTSDEGMTQQLITDAMNALVQRQMETFAASIERALAKAHLTVTLNPNAMASVIANNTKQRVRGQ